MVWALSCQCWQQQISPVVMGPAGFAQDTSLSISGRLKSALAVLREFPKPQSQRIPEWFVLEGISKLISNPLSQTGTPSPKTRVFKASSGLALKHVNDPLPQAKPRF